MDIFLIELKAISNTDLWSELKTSLTDNKDKLNLIFGSVLGTLFVIKLYQLYDNDKRMEPFLKFLILMIISLS